MLKSFVKDLLRCSIEPPFLPELFRWYLLGVLLPVISCSTYHFVQLNMLKIASIAESNLHHIAPLYSCIGHGRTYPEPYKRIIQYYLDLDIYKRLPHSNYLDRFSSQEHTDLLHSSLKYMMHYSGMLCRLVESRMTFHREYLSLCQFQYIPEGIPHKFLPLYRTVYDKLNRTTET